LQEVLIEANQRIPTSFVREFTTVENNQDEVIFKVHSSEQPAWPAARGLRIPCNPLKAS